MVKSKSSRVSYHNSLFDSFLQPSPAPATASEDQLEMMSTILTIRSRELGTFSLSALKSVFAILESPNEIPLVQKDISSIVKENPNKAPKEKKHYISFIKYLLVCNLHMSLDETIRPDDRMASLDAAKRILKYVDDCPSHPKRSADSAKNSLPKNSSSTSASSNSSARPNDSGNDSAAHTNTSSMAVVQENEIIILDDSDDDDNDGVTLSTAQKPAQKQPSQPSSQRSSSSSIEKIDRPRNNVSNDQDKTRKNPPIFSNHAKAKGKRPSFIPMAAKKKRIAVYHDIPFHIQSRYPKPNMIPIFFQADGINGHSFSESLKGRNVCNMYVHCGPDRSHENPPTPTTFTNGSGLTAMYQRFEKWEPFWRMVYDCSKIPLNNMYDSGKISQHNQFYAGYKTAHMQQVRDSPELPQTACVVKAHFPHSETGVEYGRARSGPSGSYINGEKRVLIRTLEINRPAKYEKEKADTHVWPKGTFLQWNGRPLKIFQRKQQSHNPSLWKGMCHVLDITQHISNPNISQTMEIGAKDTSLYYVQVALCEYISPESVCRTLMGSGEGCMQKLSYEQGHANAMKYANVDTVVLDSDSDDEGEKPGANNDKVTLTFSLLCPVSMSAIEIPVRGSACKHLQCFDLMNYLNSNKSVCGGRWRCAVCENFVAVDDLVLDGMMSEMISEYGHLVTGSRDKIQFSSDGEWTFMNENRLRYRKKRSAEDSQNEGGSAKRSTSQPSDNVVISLD